MSELPADREQESKIWIGVDIGGTKTAVVLSSQPPVMLARIEFPTLPANGPERAIELIKRSIHQLVDNLNIDNSRLGRIGVSCGGPLNQAAGIIQAPPNLSTWADVPITSILQQEFAIDCRIENDANAGAVAEHRFGAGQGTRHMVFLTMGTGLGAGVIAGGILLSRSVRPGRRDRSCAAHTLWTRRIQQGGLGRGLGQRGRSGSGSSARGRGRNQVRRVDTARLKVRE